ncbi:PREDICTED: uncharacterized protein LOC104818527 isoform X2 [Tarenaya hassleriana]|uniref:uncharacterized protein LOC104818527 isoform X2 n=1 Tax=Tarenaya hassleriana TaxID=28532 RepID=UPI00053C7C84|nr:PREDICTED: uncharacterized protein LOC104818527 isoform X2 [Tarenaya hassleriana]
MECFKLRFRVFPASQPVDEHANRNLRRDIDLRIQSKANEASTLTWISKRSPVIVIDLEQSPSTKETEPSASVSCTERNLESQPPVLSGQSISKIQEAGKSLVDDDRCSEKLGFSDKGYNMSSSKQSFVSCEPCLLDLNETPVDEPYPDRNRYFLQDLNCPYSENTTPSCEKSGVEDPAPFCTPRSRDILDKDGTTSPASYTSCCTTENDSRIKPVPSCRTRLEYPDTEALPTEPRNGSCNEEDPTETSSFIQIAAESLVCISRNSSYQHHQDLPSKPESRSNSPSRDRDLPSKEPECSYDSYELLTLELTETSHEDNCVSSKAVDELNITGESKELGFKLRRGRRMKNFQKEILPGLVSLSRHEIREDINVLEAVLRSREYKKMHGNTGDDKCGKNPRKRRPGSGQRHVGRRRRRRGG